MVDLHTNIRSLLIASAFLMFQELRENVREFLRHLAIKNVNNISVKLIKIWHSLALVLKGNIKTREREAYGKACLGLELVNTY